MHAAIEHSEPQYRVGILAKDDIDVGKTSHIQHRITSNDDSDRPCVAEGNTAGAV